MNPVVVCGGCDGGCGGHKVDKSEEVMKASITEELSSLQRFMKMKMKICWRGNLGRRKREEGHAEHARVVVIKDWGKREKKGRMRKG